MSPRTIKGGLAVLLILLASTSLVGQLLKSRGPDADGLPIPVIKWLKDIFPEAVAEPREETPLVADSEGARGESEEPAGDPPATPQRYRYADGSVVFSPMPPSVDGGRVGSGFAELPDDGPASEPGEAQDPDEQGPDAPGNEDPDEPPAGGSNAGRVGEDDDDSENPKAGGNASRPVDKSDGQGNGNKNGLVKNDSPAKPAGQAKKNVRQSASAAQKTTPPQSASAAQKVSPPPAATPNQKVSPPKKVGPASKSSPANPKGSKWSAPKGKGGSTSAAGRAVVKNSVPKNTSKHLSSVKPQNNIDRGVMKKQTRPSESQQATKGKAAGRKG